MDPNMLQKPLSADLGQQTDFQNFSMKIKGIPITFANPKKLVLRVFFIT